MGPMPMEARQSLSGVPPTRLSRPRHISATYGDPKSAPLPPRDWRTKIRGLLTLHSYTDPRNIFFVLGWTSVYFWNGNAI